MALYKALRKCVVGGAIRKPGQVFEADFPAGAPSFVEVVASAYASASDPAPPPEPDRPAMGGEVRRLDPDLPFAGHETLDLLATESPRPLEIEVKLNPRYGKLRKPRK